MKSIPESEINKRNYLAWKKHSGRDGNQRFAIIDYDRGTIECPFCGAITPLIASGRDYRNIMERRNPILYACDGCKEFLTSEEMYEKSPRESQCNKILLIPAFTDEEILYMFGKVDEVSIAFFELCIKAYRHTIPFSRETAYLFNINQRLLSEILSNTYVDDIGFMYVKPENKKTSIDTKMKHILDLFDLSLKEKHMLWWHNMSYRDDLKNLEDMMNESNMKDKVS